MKNIFTILIVLLLGSAVKAQHHEAYIPPTDPAVKQKLSQWQDLKFGLFMHWGPYSEWGVVESWSLCPEDEGWTQRKGPYSADYYTYKKAYENLQTTFNPTRFDPDKWVKAAKDAGMKYVVFTTKHHDGFCMFDTKQTDYKITRPKTPFSANPKSNVANEIFSAFRKENFMIGAYFSKPDWHSPDYWWPYFPPKDRNVNYDPAKHPDKWQKFKDFTYNQIQELMTGYGKIDILWMDGGWVRPLSTVDTTVDWQRGIKVNQDIDMPRIAKMARAAQPGLIMVDRTVTGPYENYTTPEQQIPAEPIDHPWETCMTMGNSWSYVPGDKYKSPQQIVQLLVKIVSRGGNLLMNIGPGPDGDWDPEAYKRLADIGKWIKINGEGIYSSKSVAPYSDGNIFFTQSADGRREYAFVLAGENGLVLPHVISLKTANSQKVKQVRLLGSTQKLRWKQDGGTVAVTLPASLQNGSGLQYAATFKLTY
ncbi:alpha-L-fucosidase [Mucilaginibacter sp. L3T2-6]|uniref:alpha-L-fucosidase n=1 Tax=Mucilaginibacter sp. L3T2-6 TaxID=3062491 RepID=UPI002676E122|nr:alpha-L-fucosidase [Mucilaginibacter sp. L3T2-6]MDO3643884.1 alpha-L-fucosidase [Mucilaginibacter sp. L3T2-6]MDV6216393.1 alpha-L-fucosidase [Mucilaginibacter sp. L3T2-6]